ncbi:MAG: orotidine-5'-phosphate decarboxylase [Alphaproteobacteria bacterium]|nr:orotidine-5'-phosphate decarboxylase [Alphaproteobacteria bacterium]
MKIYTAIDTPDPGRALELSKALASLTGIKLGLEFFSSRGPQGIEKIMQACPGAEFFLDLKYHDIPNTVAGAVKAISHSLKPAYLNVHASGGSEMLRAAKEACHPATKLLAVTVLTSMDEDSLNAVGQGTFPFDQVQRLALLAKESGLDGVVCSAHEIEMLRRECGPDFILMVPGIRPAGSDAGDQKRVMTPQQAMKAGATHLVIGRPITQSKDPAAAAKAILQELE